MICVDELREYPNRPFGHRHWAHLWSDTHDLDELHAFAASIGLRGSWFQNKTRFPHYDVTAEKHALALRHGAVLTNIREAMRQIGGRH